MSIKLAPPVMPSEIELQPLSNTAINESPVNRSTETLELSGARLEGYISWDNLNDEQEKQLQGWLASLRGAAGRFTMPHYRYLKPAGAVTGNPIVSANNQYGGSIAIKQLAPNITGFKIGDWVSINSELKIVTETCISNGMGQAQLIFEPPLRKVVNQGVAIVYQAASGIFRLRDDKQGRVKLRRDKESKLKIEVVEAF
jgi:hypothetical protein